MAEHVGQILGNYQLLSLLGRGAFAEVYLAEHRYLEVPAAIKILHVRMEPNTQEQFLREARTIAHLQHSHIVRVLDFGFQDETPYLVMEFTPNGTLRARHPKGTRLSLDQIIHYVKQIAPALDYAHQQRVIHRDMKPENLLLNANDEVVLSDFGIAVVQQSRDTLLTQNQAGTPAYMAPEQIQGKPTAASDQYALGVLVYEWLCGEPPFRGTLFEVLSQHLHETPPSLCARIPSLPLAVEDAVFSALAKEPHARFVSVQDFADVLEEVRDATQPLLLSLSPIPLSPDQIFPPDTLPPPMHAPSLEQPDQSASTTQTLVLTRRQTADGQVQAASLPREGISVSRTNRQRLLKKVRTFWIAGVLERSLYGNALVALGLEEQPDVVASPWQLVLHHPTSVPRPLPAGTHITEVYDAADGELLILGAPGSGKTTLLLELTRDLLDRAERDEQHPMPVVFNLASWATHQQPLADWLVEELNSSYQVPRKLGQALVEAEQILPLLDGLDEVAPKVRTACIETINGYRQEHGLLPLVVCSRSADYLAQEARVQLGSAVAIQPLTEQQVDDYLVRGGQRLQALRQLLRKDADLRALAKTPLMLNVLMVVSQGTPQPEFTTTGSLRMKQEQIFASYVQRALTRRSTGTRYTHQQTMHWLSYLAGQMRRQSQTVFYIEQMQPTWISGAGMFEAYRWLAVRLPGVLIGLLVTLVVFTTFFFLNIPAIITGILLGGLLGGLLSEGSITQPPATIGVKVRSIPWQQFIRWLLVGVLIGLGVGLSFGLGIGLSFEPSVGQIFGPDVGLSAGLSFGLCSILLQVFLVKSHKAPSPSQALLPVWKMKWQRLIRSAALRNGVLAGLSFGLSSGLTAGLFSGLGFGLTTAALVFGEKGTRRARSSSFSVTAYRIGNRQRSALSALL
jgi:serine/threonine protein kinase/GTPase SAR1 family protein